MWTKLRSVVLQPTAQTAIDDYTKNLHRFDEAYVGLEWLIVRTPERGAYQEVHGRQFRVYVQSGDELAETPDIWIVYEVTETEIIVHDIKAKEHTPDAGE